MEDKKYLVLLSSFIFLGSARIKLLIKYFGNAKKVWEASSKMLKETGLNAQLVRNFIDYRTSLDPDKFFKNLSKSRISAISFRDDNYPKNLIEIPDFPVVIYIKGRLLTKDRESVAIVGTRQVTDYGRQVTEHFAKALAKMGIPVVSGLALGVDMLAHQSVLANKGRCLAVLASGVDLITPQKNQQLGEEILKKGGCIISEYPPATHPEKYFFPYRNRLISGLARAVIVVEGKLKSGTMHTALHATSQGKTVFAVPGPINSLLSQAPNYLIQNGARALTSIKDITDEFKFDKVNTITGYK